MYKYFYYPFGIDSDALTYIPDNATIDGTVSYQQGWTSGYSVDDYTSVNYLPIPRGVYNQLLLDITENLQQYQQFGVFPWQSGVSYSRNSHVLYNNEIYESVIDNNTSTPSTNDDWFQISGIDSRIPAGAGLIWMSAGNPEGRWILADGSYVSRTTYPQLFTALCPTVACTITAGNTTISGFDSTAEMFVGMCLENAAALPNNTKITSIINAYSVTVSAAPTANTNSVTVIRYGDNSGGTSTFALPSLLSRIPAGAGGSGLTVGSTTVNKVGQAIGAQKNTITLNNMPDHSHDALTGQYVYTGTGGQLWEASSSFNAPAVFRNTTGTVTNESAEQGISVVQPFILVKYFLRY